MRDQTIINKLLINYYRFKKEGDKTVIFLHGWRSEGAIWKATAELMKYDNLALYALDLPGFGASAVPKKALSIDDYADIVLEFIKKFKLEKVILVGHSFGGRISIKIATTHPELIDKVILVDSAGLNLSSGKTTTRKVFARLFGPFFKPKFMQGLRRRIYRKMGAEDYISTPYLKETYLKTIKEDLRDCLPKIILPTLIIWGAKDTETPLKFADIMNKEIKNSEKVIFPGAGHFSFLDCPQEFANQLIKFIIK